MSSIWTKIAVVGGVVCGLGELALSPSMDGAAGISIAIARSAWRSSPQRSGCAGAS